MKSLGGVVVERNSECVLLPITTSLPVVGQDYPCSVHFDTGTRRQGLPLNHESGGGVCCVAQAGHSRYAMDWQ